ncbi:baseplate assembly protein [Asticcacaulis machinosus]|uniref:Baseplate J/gp47 family protein n=1 Tax=Asticcacaulis machinosus TaxID=2984211 RepID=A0ABT5HGL2_9CAUL|nr:baseplate J/gp47 family protein [Asticcacaulis machinosus]MDC7675379.1 baseplate J/gp47 family protein [Asticcacaulis machinosus]
MSDATFNAIDLSRLPAPNVIEPLSYEQILADTVASLKAFIPDFDDTLESDPIVKLLEVVAYREFLMRQRINDAGKARMLAYAMGSDLDHIGATFGVERLMLTPANPETGAPAVMEGDEDFRERIQLAPEGYSVAGPAGAYIYHARSAHSDVADASVASPAPGEVVVTILSRTGSGVATSGLINTVQAALSASDKRPLTDEVTVQAAQIIEYQVTAQVKTYPGPDGGIVIENGLANAQALAVRLHKLGRDVNRAAFFAAINGEGAQNTLLTSPAADIVIADHQASRCTGITITHVGTDE